MDCYDELGNRYQLPVYVLSAPINLLREGSLELDAVPDVAANALPAGPTIDVPIKLHLSTGSDLRLTVSSSDNIGSVKRQIEIASGVDAHRLRIFFAGKQLCDRQRIDEVKIHRGYTLQVVVFEPLVVRVASQKTSSVATKVCPANVLNVERESVDQKAEAEMVPDLKALFEDGRDSSDACT